MAEGKDYNINIVLRLRDEASAQLKSAMSGASKEAENLNKKSSAAHKSITDGFKDAGKQIKDFRRAAFAATAVIAGVISITKEWGKHNEQTRDAFNSLGLSIRQTIALIGSLLAPTIVELAKLFATAVWIVQKFFTILHTGLATLTAPFYSLTAYVTSFFSALKEGTSILDANKIATESAKKAWGETGEVFKENLPYAEAAKVALENYCTVQQNLDLLFKSGQITAQEYFNGIVTAQNEVINQNTIIAQQARDYILLAQEVANTQLLSFQATLQGQTDLFNTYKEMYIQGHADMYALANSLSQAFYSNMSSALSSIILGEKKASEAMAEFGKAMVTALVNYLVQQAIAWAVSSALQTVIAGATAGMAATLASAWAPAAAMASLATLGGNSSAAIAGMATTTAAAYALAVPKPMALGGEGVVNTPTLFLAGEAGPERYNFTPLWKESGQPSKQTINHISVTIHNPNVRSDQDIEKLTEEVSKRIALEAERL